MGRIERRTFLGGAAATLGLTGCAWGRLGGARPQLKFGVVSDIHVTTRESTQKFREALRYFRRRGADAVMVAGDLSDWGLRSGLKYVKEAWDEEMSGTDAVPLFITGNHDWDGWWYGDMTLDMHIQGYSEDDAFERHDPAKCWEQIFGEPFAPIRRRTVKGFDFVSTEWYSDGEPGANDAIIAWLKAHPELGASGRPFFFFRHMPIPGTVSSSSTDEKLFALRNTLATFPNCVTLCGHTHRTFFDERSVWQDGFTAISIPSLSYTSQPHGYENGSDVRRNDVKRDMEPIPSRPNLEEAQGYFISVFADRLEVERQDFTVGAEAAAPWIIPLKGGSDFTPAARAARAPVPQFAADAALKAYVANADTRNGSWTIFMTLEFPTPDATEARAFDYEVRIVSEKDGRVLKAKKYLSPAYYKPADLEPKVQKFLFNAMDLPETGPYRFVVVPRNSFGAQGRPLRSRVFESKPGKERARSADGTWHPM